MQRIHRTIENAYKVLDGGVLSREEALELDRQVSGAGLLDLISLANKVKDKYVPEISACSILNAKSGVCSQNCKFCAQSAHYQTGIDTYPLVAREQALAALEKVHASGVRSFGYVTSGYGYLKPDREFEYILETLDAMEARFPEMKLCVSLGVLSEQTAKLLSEHHCGRYNINLQTAPGKYAELVADTHGIQQKIDTVKYLQAFGVEICCGGIFGLGESSVDRIDLALAVRELDVEGIPLNVLMAIPGTPLEKLPVMEPAEVAKSFALFRLLNPAKMIKFAGGRETVMKDFQGLLMLAGVNALMTGGYLTTRGRSVAEDEAFIGRLKHFSSDSRKLP
ncbi:MAG: biotin synthase BioB [Victivallaceae bacterium]|nr:biotin synthase BioB [Victivallaceae bacterium]